MRGTRRSGSKGNRLDLDALPLAPLYNASPVGVLLADDTGTILAANPALCRLVRRDEEELRGRPLEWIVHPEDRWPGPVGGGVRLVAGDGDPIWVEVSETGAAFSGGAGPTRLVLVRDAIEERRLARELEAARARFQQLTDNVRDGFLLLTPTLDRIVQASDGLAALLAGGDDRGQPSFDALHPEDRGRLREEAAKVSSECREVSLRLLGESETVRAWLQMRLFPLREPSGGVEHVGAIVEDITARKQVAEMLAQARQHAARLVQTVQDPQGILRGGEAWGRSASGPAPLWTSEDETEERRAYATRSASLTPREREVMELLVVGGTTKAIAAELSLSPKTVEVYRARVMKKMEASSVAALVRLVLLGSPRDSS